MKKQNDGTQNQDKKKYQKPKLIEYGSVREFTRGFPTGAKTETGTGNKIHKTCIGPLSEIEEHRILLQDNITQDGFRKAILETVRPGDTVLDLGTGTGLHALFACQAGARKVYAIESSTVIELAKAVARENHFSDQIEFVYGNSREVELPEKVDVIITHTGFMNTLSDLPDACRRFLKPGGKLIPGQVRLSFVPVEDPTLYQDRIDFWGPEHYGLSFRSLQPYASSHPQYTHFSQTSFLCSPATFAPIDFSKPVPTSFQWTADLEVERTGFLHGLAGWYTYHLSAATQLSTKPPLRLSPELWSHPFLPLKTPLAVKSGQRLHLELGFYLEVTAHDPIWTWKLSLDGEPVVSQTSFDTVPLSQALLAKLSH